MTKSIQLRIAEIEDAPFLHTLFNDPKVIDYWFEEPYVSRHQLEEQIKKQDKETRLFIITDRAEVQIGLVAFYFINGRHRHAEFAIALDPAHQGKGYATKATRLALAYAFNVLNLYKVYLIVVVTNEKAIHIYEKFGFKTEGVLKQHYYINGRYEDGMIMGLFKEDYLVQK